MLVDTWGRYTLKREVASGEALQEGLRKAALVYTAAYTLLALA